MSQQNIQVVKAFFEAWNAGDIDSFRELFHPDAILRMAPDWPEPGPYFGREAVTREFAQLRETYDAGAVEVISVIDVADRVVVRFIWRGSGQGPDVNMELTGVYTVRKGKLLSIEHSWDHAETLETWGCRSTVPPEARRPRIARSRGERNECIAFASSSWTAV